MQKRKNTQNNLKQVGGPKPYEEKTSDTPATADENEKHTTLATFPEGNALEVKKKFTPEENKERDELMHKQSMVEQHFSQSEDESNTEDKDLVLDEKKTTTEELMDLNRNNDDESDDEDDGSIKKGTSRTRSTCETCSIKGMTNSRSFFDHSNRDVHHCLKNDSSGCGHACTTHAQRMAVHCYNCIMTGTLPKPHTLKIMHTHLNTSKDRKKDANACMWYT